MNNYAREANEIVKYIHNLDNFTLCQRSSKPAYNHMGAILADTVLQSGLNYINVVKPRIERILTEYNKYDNLNKFILLIDQIGVETILKWKHKEKVIRFKNLISHLKDNKINNYRNLCEYLQQDSNRNKLMEIRGISYKTVDYMHILCGGDVIAVDRHIHKFTLLAGLKLKKYDQIKKTVEYSADFLNVKRSVLDKSIWNYMRVISNSTQYKLIDMED